MRAPISLSIRKRGQGVIFELALIRTIERVLANFLYAHPVNSRRLLAMAYKLQLFARRQGDPARAEALRFIGARLEQFARDLDDPAMQQLIVRRAVSGDPRDLQGR